MQDQTVVIHPPLYIVRTSIKCWQCGSDMPAICLIASSIDDSEDNGAMVLSNIFNIPPAVSNYIQSFFQNYLMRYSKTTKSQYYANACPECDVITGDWFLHREPDSPFWPSDEENARLLSIQPIPLKEAVEFATEYHNGAADLIINNAQRH